ncbi:MAG: hypothetical protein J5J00_15830 [Deltaproteobacteria bacterium]|nr:hypothetical protein [Deltaproteobacteria bacterium]
MKSTTAHQLTLSAPHSFSETSGLKSVLLALPEGSFDDERMCDYFGYYRVIDLSAARAELEKLAEAYSVAGVQVYILNNLVREGQCDLSALPNVLFPRDVAGVLGKRIFIGSQPYSSRAPEFEIMAQVLEDLFGRDQLVVPNFDDPLMTGEFGDFVCVKDRTLLVNIGHRTSLRFAQMILASLFEYGFESVAFVQLPRELRYAHLDLACNVSPSGGGLLLSRIFKSLVLREYLSDGRRTFIPLERWAERHGLTLEFITDSEQEQGLVNYVFINRDEIITGTPHPRLAELACSAGVKLHTVPLDEVFAAGGRVRCATLVLEREE